ncbi:chalcone isomerase family protein [Alteromonas sp. KUL49]|uniref:chalcone isomerase family protein n=1 Tax=Alteromonas sp. KUL49 TaxID=2480798 RepID=UPI001F5F7BA8|nr:chalcone isomerase family protein [Alteromonas sp. KUL49]
MSAFRRELVIGAFMVLSVFGASINAQQNLPTRITMYVPEAALVGEEMFRYLFWKVYQAQLYAPNGEYSSEQPYALRLTYQRSLDGEKIAERSADEIAQQGGVTDSQLDGWLQQMIAIFPDVKKGDVILGVATEDKYTVFYLNEEEIGRVEDTEFTERFFGIWLDPRTSAPDFRRALLKLPG